jgi:hypothetical protein
LISADHSAAARASIKSHFESPFLPRSFDRRT